MKESIKLKLKFKEYEFYPDKILFKTKVSCGRIKVHPTLENFAYLDKAYVRIGDEIKVINLHGYYDRRTRQLNGYVSIKLNRKLVEVYVKTKSRFGSALKAALESKQKLSELFRNDERLYINESGKLLIKLLVTISSGTKSHSEIHHFLKSDCKSLYFKTLLNFIRNANLDEYVLTPFVENYYVAIVKEELKFPNTLIDLPKNIYRTVGLLNGDGHLSRYGIYFYGKNRVLHEDFKNGIKSINDSAKFKYSQDENGNIRTYLYSVNLAKKLHDTGVLLGKKSTVSKPINIPNNFNALTEYISGIFDAEGSFVKDYHIVIPTCTSIYNENSKTTINGLTREEYEYLLSLATSYGALCELPTGYKYYRLGIKSLKTEEKILKKALSLIPILAKTNKEILKRLGINSTVNLKCFLIYPQSRIINTVWWTKITSIENVIKFYSIIDTHSSQKKNTIQRFVRNYIPDKELVQINQHIKSKML